MRSRIANIQKYIASQGLDGFLISRSNDAKYALGNDSLGWNEVILVPPTGDALRISPYDIVESYARWGEDASHCFPDGFAAVNAEGNVGAALGRIAAERGLKKLGFTAHDMRVPLYRSLVGAEGVELYDVGRDHTELFRRVKDAIEIENITMAQRITERALEDLLPYIVPGAVENELKNMLLANMIKYGAEDRSCLLLASGAETGEVHAHATDKKIEKGDIVQFDIGSVYNGYCSDMSRVFAVGSVTDEQRRIYDLVIEAQEAGIAAFNVGAVGKDVHNAAHDVFRREGLGDYFTHTLGHNVGMDIHEGPSAAPDCEETFEVGHLVTIEPGLYFEGKFGMRVEDMIYLSPEGKVNLTNTTKELRILK